MAELIKSFKITMNGDKCGATFHDERRCSGYQFYGDRLFFAEGTDMPSVFENLGRQINRYVMGSDWPNG